MESELHFSTISDNQDSQVSIDLDTLLIDFDGSFNPATIYSIEITADAIQGLNGSNFAGLDNYTFTTLTGTKEIQAGVRGTSLYAIAPGPNWDDAEKNSIKLGGHLHTTNNQQEADDN